jgi:radical SAM protein with 4Fe4S-binding SPASM domain
MTHYNIDLSYWAEMPYNDAQQKLEQQLRDVYKEAYNQDEKIVLSHNVDFYVKESKLGLVLRNVQILLNEIDISNAFVVINSTNANIANEAKLLQNISTDPMGIEVNSIEGEFTANKLELHPYSKKENYEYGSVNPLKISLENVSKRERDLLTTSETFCMYPWIHLHAFPTGQALPCCMADMHAGVIGNCRDNSLEEIWNSDNMKQLRLDMLNNRKNDACKQCYEKEKDGFFSGRQSANKHHGHLIERVLETNDDGSYDTFELAYWDIRFSNLCNLKCRSCGHIFSSQWYKDQAALAGPEWEANNTPKVYAGRSKTDMLEQLLEHIDYVEQIYFAGGEPLVMEEHYIILDELIKRGKTDVRLIYNTNFTQVKLKDKRVFEQWKHFTNVAVGASLDGMGKYAEYIRSGTKWADVERNRRDMLEQCPHVDFYISATVSIMNALHVADFHRDWVEKGLIQPQDFNFNVLLDPPHYRIDVATPAYKDTIREKYARHLEWLKPLDLLNRASVGFESALNMLANDNTHLLDKFWAKTEQLDTIRNENVFDFLPELKALR